jgi:transcriptional regulator with XRE-family HTH domain
VDGKRYHGVDDEHEIGCRIRAARQARQMTLAELGGTELSRSFLSLVERGKSRISLRALAIVAGKLDLPVSYFLDQPGAGSSDTPQPDSPAEVAVRVLRQTPHELTIEVHVQRGRGGGDVVRRI